MARDHRRLATIVSLDAAGYSPLMGVDDSGTLASPTSRDAREFRAHIAMTTGMPSDRRTGDQTFPCKASLPWT
jgi:hypothetical protein